MRRACAACSRSALTDLQARLPAEQMEALRQAATQLSGTIARQVGGFVGSVVTGGLFLINLLSLLFITPIVTFYLLRDWDRMMAKLNDLLPLHYADTVREQLALIDRRLAGFVRGQMIVAGILGSFYAIALSLAGLEFGLVIGLAAGAISFIPFVGSVSGFVVSVALALVQFDTWPPVAIVAGIFGVGQLVEGNFLTPKLVGDKVGLHPVWVIFALLAGGSLLGLVGMLLAVPLAAVIGVLVAFAITRYRGSVLYHGAGDIRALPPAGDDGEDTDEGKGRRGVNARQLALDLRHRPALGRDDFLVAASNEAAVRWIDRWPDWPAPGMVLWGPPGCGKSHLAAVWRHRAGGPLLTPGEVAGSEPPALLDGTGRATVEDVDSALPDRRFGTAVAAFLQRHCRTRGRAADDGAPAAGTLAGCPRRPGLARQGAARRDDRAPRRRAAGGRAGQAVCRPSADHQCGGDRICAAAHRTLVRRRAGARRRSR